MKVITDPNANIVTHYIGSLYLYNGRKYVLRECDYTAPRNRRQVVIEPLTWRHRLRHFFTGRYLSK